MPSTGLEEVSCKAMLQNQFILMSRHSTDDYDFWRDDDDDDYDYVDDDDDDDDDVKDDGGDNNECDDDAV